MAELMARVVMVARARRVLTMEGIFALFYFAVNCKRRDLGWKCLVVPCAGDGEDAALWNSTASS